MLNIGQLGAAAGNEHLVQKIAWQMVNLGFEVQNAFANWYLIYASEHPETVNGMIELLRQSPGRIRCMSQIPKGKGPILICGSGGSIDDIMPTVKDWKGPVMCSSSQASTLVHYGKIPDYVLVLDPRIAPADELAAPDWGNAVMLGHVSIPTEYMMKWLRRTKNPIYLGRIMEPTYDFYSHHLGQGYPWIRHIIMPMIDTMAGEIGFATWLGYKPIFMAGCDYWGPRFDRYDWHYDTQSWTLDAVSSKVAMSTNQAGAKALGYSSRGTLLSAFLQMANPKYQQEIWQLSDRSKIDQFPRAEWKDVLAAQGATEEYPDRKHIMDEIEISLAVWETFLVPVPGGWGMDYHTYIAAEENGFMAAMSGYNTQILNNKRDFANLEKQNKAPIAELISRGQITIEAGELLLHGADEFKDWDWHKIEPINIGEVLLRRQWLLAEAKRRGYTKDMIMSWGNDLAPKNEILREDIATQPIGKEETISIDKIRADVHTALGVTGEKQPGGALEGNAIRQEVPEGLAEEKE